MFGVWFIIPGVPGAPGVMFGVWFMQFVDVHGLIIAETGATQTIARHSKNTVVSKWFALNVISATIPTVSLLPIFL